MPICSGENLYGLREYRPFFELRAMDVVMIDVPWNGFARLASRSPSWPRRYELNVAPHNYYSHLSTLHSRPPLRHACPTSASWRSTSTTCRGRTSW